MAPPEDPGRLAFLDRRRRDLDGLTELHFEVVQDCFEVTGGVFDELIAKEKSEGLTGN